MTRRAVYSGPYASSAPPVPRRASATMAPRALRYTRRSPRRLVGAPAAVTHDMVRSTPGGACFGGACAGGAPASAPPPPPRVAMSPLDTFLFVRLLQIPVAFFFAARVDEAQLAQSLSRTLARFPMVAGRLRPAAAPSAAAGAAAAAPAGEAAAVRGQFDVLCNNEGVIFDVFECDGGLADFDGFADWSVAGRHTQPRDNTTPPRFCGKLDPSAIVAGTEPMARFRLTHLKDGGSIVGMTFSHMLVDGIAGMSFVAAWSGEHEALLASREAGVPPAGVPVFDRAVFVTAATSAPPEEDVPPETRANTGAVHAKVARLLTQATPAKVARRVLKMGADVALRKNACFAVCISAAQMARARAAGSAASPATPLSANDVAVGLAWALLRRGRARGVSGAPRLGSDEHFLLQTVDLRRYLPGLPQAYFGNCAWALQVAAPVAAGADPLALAAGCRASLALFTDSTAVFDQAALMLRATGGTTTSKGQQLRTTMLPAFGDGMVSSWHAPFMWTFSFGAGPPRWFYGCIFPVAPWGFCVQAGRPDAGGGYLLCGTCPAAKVAAMTADAEHLIAEMAGPEHTSPPPAAAPPAEQAADVATAAVAV